MNDKEKTKLQNIIVKSLPLKPHGRLLLAPRIGKTRIVIEIIKKNKPKSILWVTPSSKLATVDIPREFLIWKAEKYLPILKTVTWKSLNKITGHYDLIIFDEDQKITKQSVKNISVHCENLLSFKYILSMTGTNSKQKDKQDLYQKLELKTLYTLTFDEAIDTGILADYTVNVVKIPLGKTKTIKAGSKEKFFMTTEEANYNYINKTTNEAIANNHNAMIKVLYRMRTIYNSESKLKSAKNLINTLKGRKLVFCSNIKQAEELSNCNYHSKTSTACLESFSKGESDLITMVNSGGTGFTYKNIDHLIMVQCSSDTNGESFQKIARTLSKQKNYTAQIWILMLVGTKDENWVQSTLNSFDKNKINYLETN